MSYTGIIFDVDGTLLNTIDDLANSMNSVLKKHGFPEHTTEKYKYFVGSGMEKLARRALPKEEINEKMIMIYLEELKDEYSKRWNEFTRPYERIKELLDNLDALGIQMSVLSNKPHQFTKIVIDKFFGLDRFGFVLGARVGIPKKPDPYSALEISRLSGIPASNYIYLGDSGVDMKTASVSGMYAVGATWGFREDEELLENGAKTIIKSPMEIINIVNKSL